MLSRLPATLRASSLMACSRNVVAAPAKRSVGVSVAGPDRLGNGPDDAASYRPEWHPHPLRRQTWVLLHYSRRPLAHSFRLVDRLTWLYQASFLSSRAALASATAFTVGTIAWYTHLYGTLPFIGEISANSPAEEGLHPPAYPWSHKGLLDSFDHARYAFMFGFYAARAFGLAPDVADRQYSTRVLGLQGGLCGMPFPGPHCMEKLGRCLAHSSGS
jgi:hypothetical protein